MKKYVIVLGIMFLFCSCTSKSGSEKSFSSDVSQNNTAVSSSSYQQKETTSADMISDSPAMTESAETNEAAYDTEPQSDFIIAVNVQNNYNESDGICSGEFLLYNGELYLYKFKNDEKPLIDAINEAYRNNENIEYIKTIDETEAHDLYKMICTANYSEDNLRGQDTDSPEGEYMYVLSVCRKKADGTTEIFPVTGNIDESCVDIYERFYEIYGPSEMSADDSDILVMK